MSQLQGKKTYAFSSQKWIRESHKSSNRVMIHIPLNNPMLLVTSTNQIFMPDLFLSLLYNSDTSGMVKTARKAKSIPLSLGCNQQYHAWWNTANPTGSGPTVQRDAFTTALTLQTQLRVESKSVLLPKPELTAGYRQSKHACWGAQ